MKYLRRSLIIINIFFSGYNFAQSDKDSVVQMTLEDCINFAMINQPAYKQSQIDEEIAQRNYRLALSNWFPQLNSEFAFQHYFELPTTLIPTAGNPNVRTPVRFGVPNVSYALFRGDQLLFSTDAVLGYRAGKYSKLQAFQNKKRVEIDVVVNVTKAFYDVLVTEQQIKINIQNIERQKKLYNDSYYLYESGVTDKIDYKRSSITLNNTLSERKRLEESLKYKYAFLKQVIGYPYDKDIVLSFDVNQMQEEILMDTTKFPDFNKRIEYQILNTQKHLQDLNMEYYKYGFLPSVSAFILYNFYYQSLHIDDLYKIIYPFSQAGLKITLPIFNGHKRVENLSIAKLEVKRLELDQEYFKEQLQAEYAMALGRYKSFINEYKIQKENMQTALEVYDLVKYQYDEGIKTYLDVITTEVELRTSQLNYLNSLYNVLSSKMDMQKSLGIIQR